MGAGAEEESLGTFHLDSLEVQVSGSLNSFSPFRLKSSIAKRIEPM